MSARGPQPTVNFPCRRNPWNARGLLPYSRPAALAKLDQRTREARIMREARAELTAHVGGTPTATQKALIDRAAMLTLHLARMDAKAIESGELSGHASRQYLAWSNTLTRTLARLGLEGAPAPRMSLMERLRQQAPASPLHAPGAPQTGTAP
jgi:hypothetical protein